MKLRTPDFSNPLLLIALAQFTISMSFTLIDPVLPIYASSFTKSYALIGLVLSSFGITRIFFEIPGGIIMEKLGRKTLLLVGFVAVATSQVIAALAQSYIELAISRMMVGVGSALELTSSLTLIGQLSTKENRQKNIARYQSAGAAAQIIAPTLGGLLSQFISLRATFIVSALLSLTGAYVVSRIVTQNEEPSQRKNLRLPLSDLRPIFLDLRVIAVSASAFAMFLLFSSIRSTMIPLYGTNILNLNSSEIGVIFSLTSLIIFLTLFFLTDPLERALGRSKLLTVSLLVSTLAVTVLSLTSNFATLALASFPLGAGLGLLQPTPFAIIIDLSKPQNMALMMGTVRTIADIGIIIGPNIVGSLLSFGEPYWVFYVVAAIIGGIAILTWSAFKRAEEETRTE